jgi:hypothetical protein
MNRLCGPLPIVFAAPHALRSLALSICGHETHGGHR